MWGTRASVARKEAISLPTRFSESAAPRDDKGEHCGGMESGGWAALHGIAALPFIISTEAQRSGEICGFTSAG